MDPLYEKLSKKALLLYNKSTKNKSNSKAPPKGKSKMYDIHLDGVIGKSFWSDSYTAKDIRLELRNANGSDVQLLINSPGGDVFEAAAIYNTLHKYSEDNDAKISAKVMGLAASAAADIFLAFPQENREMADGTMLMFHRPWGYTMGDFEEMENYSALLKKATDVFVKKLATVVGDDYTDDELHAKLKAEWWLTPEEASAYGFAKELESDGDDDDEDDKFDVDKVGKDIDKDKDDDEDDEDDDDDVNNKSEWKVEALTDFCKIISANV